MLYVASLSLDVITAALWSDSLHLVVLCHWEVRSTRNSVTVENELVILLMVFSDEAVKIKSLDIEVLELESIALTAGSVEHTGLKICTSWDPDHRWSAFDADTNSLRICGGTRISR